MRERTLDPARIPRHLAVIMDGNGRWAESRGLTRSRGHLVAVESVRALVRASHELGIRYLTLYAFSLENWNRPKDEVDELMALCERYIQSEFDEIHRNGIRVRAIGRKEMLNPRLCERLDQAVARTRDNTEMDLLFALSYGGRAEIVDAARRLARAVETGELGADQIDEKTFAAHLYAPDVPDPDLLIRTGAEMRVSNFLLWQIAYTEIHVTDVMFPEFRKPHLVEAIRDFQGRERRFGLTSGQVQGHRAGPGHA